jgi:hypothetical protein
MVMSMVAIMQIVVGGDGGSRRRGHGGAYTLTVTLIAVIMVIAVITVVVVAVVVVAAVAVVVVVVVVVMVAIEMITDSGHGDHSCGTHGGGGDMDDSSYTVAKGKNAPFF